MTINRSINQSINRFNHLFRLTKLHKANSNSSLKTVKEDTKAEHKPALTNAQRKHSNNSMLDYL